MIATTAEQLRVHSDVRRGLLKVPPRTPGELHLWVRLVLGFDMPRRSLIAGHAAPFDYLVHTFFEDRQPRDCVVWASRGGGKTQLGAIATLLDLLFKPGIQIRILGGSFEQSSKMYRYLKQLFEIDALRERVRGNITGRGITLTNGSCIEVLSQSQRSVRGQRVHKLRCDEVDVFDREIWEAAQLVTRSGPCGDVFVPGAIEALSTMHKPYGLMQELVDDARAGQRCVFRWNLIDTLERCEPQRACETCALWDACRGRAKQADGFFAIEDALQQQSRVIAIVWETEMLCAKPDRSNLVYPHFDPAVHVQAFAVNRRWERIGGMDFGFRSPTVLLFAAHDDVHDLLYVADEMFLEGHTTHQCINAASDMPWPRPAWIGADPAGLQRNEHTGTSTVSLWHEAGWNIRTKTSRIEAGINAVAWRLRGADECARLIIHPRCEKLIESMRMYHYPDHPPGADRPVKDGPDHACDALRYLIVHLDQVGSRTRVRCY